MATQHKFEIGDRVTYSTEGNRYLGKSPRVQAGTVAKIPERKVIAKEYVFVRWDRTPEEAPLMQVHKSHIRPLADALSHALGYMIGDYVEYSDRGLKKLRPKDPYRIGKVLTNPNSALYVSVLWEDNVREKVRMHFIQKAQE